MLGACLAILGLIAIGYLWLAGALLAVGAVLGALERVPWWVWVGIAALLIAVFHVT